MRGEPLEKTDPENSPQRRGGRRVKSMRSARTQRLCGKVFFFSCIPRGKLCIVAAIKITRDGGLS
jgi:hypothetical protein